MRGSIINSSHDIGQITRAIRGEHLKRQDLRCGGNHVDDTGRHGSMAEIGVLGITQGEGACGR